MDINQIETLDKKLLNLEQDYLKIVAIIKGDKEVLEEQKINLKKLRNLLEGCRQSVNLAKDKLKESLTKEEDISPLLKEKLSELDDLLVKLRTLKQPAA